MLHSPCAILSAGVLIRIFLSFITFQNCNSQDSTSRFVFLSFRPQEEDDKHTKRSRHFLSSFTSRAGQAIWSTLFQKINPLFWDTAGHHSYCITFDKCLLFGWKKSGNLVPMDKVTTKKLTGYKVLSTYLYSIHISSREKNVSISLYDPIAGQWFSFSVRVSPGSVYTTLIIVHSLSRLTLITSLPSETVTFPIVFSIVWKSFSYRGPEQCFRKGHVPMTPVHRPLSIPEGEGCAWT